MKRFHTTAAASALLAPSAHAEANFDHGYASGLAIQACIYYSKNQISRRQFVADIKDARGRLDPWEAYIPVESFKRGAEDMDSSPAIRRAFRKCHNASKHLQSVRPAYGANI